MATPIPEAIALVGKRLAGGFRVIQHIGSGGAGHVYLAERASGASSSDAAPAPPQRVALKVLRGEQRHGGGLRRFQREALAAARVRDPHVLEIIEAHVDDAVPFFAMELLVGLDLADTLAYSTVLSPSRAAGIACAVASGLAAAHAVGVVHRDVKPENVFLVHAPNGREIVKLVDFGFAHLGADEPPASGDRATPTTPMRASAIVAVDKPRRASRPPVGTPGYMAPEQADGAPADPRSDIYALGLVLFEMLSGQAPRSVGRLASKRERPRELVSSPEMDEVLRRALEPNIGARFQTMAELRTALLATREASGIHLREDLHLDSTPPPRPRR